MKTAVGLEPRIRAFIERQEMVFVATFDMSGERDCTFRCGPRGFIRVLDVNRLAWPEYAEDANVGSVAEYPEVSLAFKGFRDTLSLIIEGRAKIMSDELMRRAYHDLPEAVPGLPPEHWVTVYVEDAYLRQG